MFALNYLKYKIKAKDEYALHSPFLYQFYTEVVKSNCYYHRYDEIENLRKQLLKNNQKINLEYKPKSQKTIKRIVKKRDISLKVGALLFEMVTFFKPSVIIELEINLGLSTLYLKGASSIKTPLYAFQTSKVLSQYAYSNMNILNYHPTIIEGNTKQKLTEFLKEEISLDFIFINLLSDNTKYIIDYFYLLLPKVNDKTIIVFNNIYRSKQEKKAWQKIKTHKSVMISIDLFKVGIIFFQKKQPKQHFTLKF